MFLFLSSILFRSNMAVRNYHMMTQTRVLGMFTVILTLVIWLWVKTMLWFVHGQHTCEISRSNKAVKSKMTRGRLLGMFVLWHWPCRFNIGPRSWHILGSRTSRVENYGTNKMWTDRQLVIPIIVIVNVKLWESHLLFRRVYGFMVRVTSRNFTVASWETYYSWRHSKFFPYNFQTSGMFLSP